jgi:hypothetical protein
LQPSTESQKGAWLKGTKKDTKQMHSQNDRRIKENN